MCIHSVIHPDALYLPPQLPREVCLPCRYGMVSGVMGGDGRLCISRLISTDPAAFLDPAFSPGQRFLPPAGELPAPQDTPAAPQG